ncbi:MAG: hypothetical protein ACLQNE_38575, partial [Thermoguttaceae bacterium]
MRLSSLFEGKAPTISANCKFSRSWLKISRLDGSCTSWVVTMPPGESWTTLRRFCQDRGDIELRLSDLVSESGWLPMPDEVFERVRNAMTAQAASGKSVVLLGLPGYLALLTDENKWAAVAALREWVDGGSGRAAVCLLRSDDGTKLILNDVFANPRYRQGKQLIEIEARDAPEQERGTAGRAEVMLVVDDLASFIPELCDTFQKYLRYTEEYPNDNSVRRIVVASKGRKLAGLSAEVRQVVCLRDCARVFYDVDDAGLSEDALRWMCGRGKEGAGKKLSETLKPGLFTRPSHLVQAYKNEGVRATEMVTGGASTGSRAHRPLSP